MWCSYEYERPARKHFREGQRDPGQAQTRLYVERLCRKYYNPDMGQPPIAPSTYFRRFPMGYFQGIDSERGVAYRVADSLGLRQFLGLSWLGGILGYEELGLRQNARPQLNQWLTHPKWLASR
jgi:hypothetical protein